MLSLTPYGASGHSHEPVNPAASGLVAPVPFDPRWTPIERSAWARINAGREVRLPGPCPVWTGADPQAKHAVARSDYTIRGAFIAQLLTRPPYKAIAAERPITIYGAHIDGDVVVREGTSAARLIVVCSTIDGRVRFVDRHMERGVDLSRVRVSGPVEFTNLRSGAAVSVSRSDVHAVDVIGSWIDGSLSLRGTRVRTGTLIASTSIGRGLRLGCPSGLDAPRWQGCRAVYGATRLLSVQTGDMLETGRAVFEGPVMLEGVEAGRGFSGQGSTYRRGLVVVDSMFGGRFQLGGTVGVGPVQVNGTGFRGAFQILGGAYGSLSIIDARIDGGLDLGASRLRRLDLTGTTVRGELRLPPQRGDYGWGEPGDDARFIARATRVGALHDAESSWPPWLKREFDGFEYARLTGFKGESERSAYLREADWFKAWLAGDESYSPQPYRHLSDILRREGQVEAANAILYEAKERERVALPWSNRYRWWLEVLRWSVGYGVGLNALCALGWMGVFALAGWVIGVCAYRRSTAISRWSLLWHSVSYTVPGFSVVRDDELAMSLRARSWFYVQRLICYSLALLAGAAAVGFIRP